MPTEKLIKKGELLGFETDTVWGLGCLPNDREAVDKIYEIKGRDRSKPLILMSNKLEHLMPYVNSMPEYAKALIDKHFPGALTLIFNKTALAPDFITSNMQTVGIRIPAHEGFQAICEQIEGHTLATTSLNFSGENPVKSYDEAILKFKDKVKIVCPKTPCQTGISSTVVLCTSPEPKVLRQGSVIIQPDF